MTLVDEARRAVEKEYERAHDIGPVKCDRPNLQIICPHANLDPQFEDINDPFAGRIPSVAELERLYADGRSERRQIRAGLPTVVLSRRDFGYREGNGLVTVGVYTGQCPDCGRWLYAIGE